MSQIKVAVIKSYNDLPLPSYSTKDSAGMDLYANVQDSIVLAQGKRCLIPTGISLAIPTGYEAQIRPRSGLAIKYGITVLNTPGTIDADYRGEINVILINLSESEFIIERGMRIAQMVFAKVESANLIEVESLDDTERSSGGFGSTGLYAKT